MPHQSTQTSPTFSFDDAKLPSSKDHFRLLDLHPSPNDSSPIICNISSHRIESPKPYTALSYVWGSNDRTHVATVGGKGLGITQSLAEALRHIRDRHNAVTIWIDQICINQDDNTEKTDQVNLMGRIYAAAAQLFVWLGPEADDSDAVMALWSDVGLAARGLGIESYWTTERAGLLRTIRPGEVLAADDEMLIFQALIEESVPRFKVLLRAMVAWTQRPWFRRVWVMQEFALPRKPPLFVCGKMKVEAELPFLAVTLYRLSGSLLLNGEPVGSESRREVQTLMDKFGKQPISHFTTIRRQRQMFDEGREGAGDTLMDILRKMYVQKEMDATDDRDRVFAVLGLASDSKQLGLKADYKVKDCSVIYAKVAKALIQRAGGLEVLSWSQFPKTRGGDIMTPLPTWAPDWRSSLAPSYHPLIIPRAGRNAVFSPSRGSLPTYLETGYENVLALAGMTLCTIEKVGNIWLDDQNNSEQPNRDQEDAHRLNHLATIEGFCRESAALTQSPYASPDRQAQAIWRVPVGDLYYSQSGECMRCDRSGQSMSELYTLAIENSRFFADMGPSEDGRYMANYDSARNGARYMMSMDYIAGKRPFLATEGYVGMGPRLMAPGDTVVIFSGAHLPHVLRRGIDRYWEYVGEAYCDGVMDGEAWNADRLTPFYLV